MHLQDKGKVALSKLKEAIPKVERFVKGRIEEFEKLGREGKTRFNFRPFLDLDFEAGVFSELCFCLLTANSSATMGIKLQAQLGDEGFFNESLESLTESFRRAGHRFPEQRAYRIVEVRERWSEIKRLLETTKSSKQLRYLLADPKSQFKIKGFGYKEASHFLRNIGRKDLAIIDRHIYRFLVENGLFGEVKTLTPKRYLEAEKVLETLCKDLGITQAELDLYIFYLKTGKVLK